MSTISGLGAANGAWSAMALRPQRPPGGMPDPMFAKIDGDGDGSVNAAELKDLLQQLPISESANSDELLAQWDGDGSGSLSKDELHAGLKALMPPQPSTQDFARSRSGGAEGLMSLDADGDKAISASEFGLNEASSTRMKELFAAIDSDGDESLSASESQAFEAALQQQVEQRQATAGEERLSQLIGRLVQGYLQPAAGKRLSLSA